MLNDVCLYLRNFFVEKIYKGSFTIKNGVLAPLDFLAEGQFYRLVGSKFNDGVYKAGDGTLTDEVLTVLCGRWLCLLRSSPSRHK